MPRYFFHVYDSYGAILDHRGMELAGEVEVRSAVEICMQELPIGSSNAAAWRIEVTDMRGVEVATFVPRPLLQ